MNGWLRTDGKALGISMAAPVSVIYDGGYIAHGKVADFDFTDRDLIGYKLREQGFEYPIYKKNRKTGTVVRFEDMRKGKVVAVGNSNIHPNHYCETWVEHTDEMAWEDCALPSGAQDGVGAPTTGVKHDQGKPAFGLIPQVALEEVAEVMTYGAKKYAPDNWRKVDNAHSRYLDAALRHINAHLRGMDDDEESGLRHLAHAVASLMMAMESDK